MEKNHKQEFRVLIKNLVKTKNLNMPRKVEVKPTPIKHHSPSERSSDKFGQSTQSIINLCELISDTKKPTKLY